MEILQRMYGSLTVLPPAVLSTFRLKQYLSLLIHYLKLYANEQIVKNDDREDSPIWLKVLRG